MRTRERQLDPTTQFSEVRCRFGARDYSGHYLFDSSNQSTFPSFQRMVDQVNPGYFRAEREGLLKPVSPMSKTTVKTIVVPAECSGRLTLQGSWYGEFMEYKFFGISGYMDEHLARVAMPAPPSIDPDIALQAALASAQTNAWDTATFLAEFGKTVEMFTSFRGRFLRHYDKVLALSNRIYSHRNAGKLTFAFADAFSEAWLTLRYGLRPLYYDMLGIQEAVNRLAKGIEAPLSRGWAVGPPATSTSQILNASLNSWYIHPSGGGSNGGTHMRISAFKEIKLESRATVGVRVSTRVATMFDVAVTSWEMMRWSFIIDWFLTIGDVIAAFSPFATGTQEYNTHTLTKTTTEHFSFTPSVVPFSGWKGGAKGSTGSVTRFREEVVRTVNNEIVPTFAFNLNIDALKILDLLTIVYSLKADILKRLAFRR